MNFGDAFAELMASPAGMAVVGVVALAILEFATGVLRSVAAKQFDVTLVDTWVRKTIAGRVLPIILLLLFGAFVPDLSIIGLQIDILTVTGTTAAAAFAASAIGSILENIRSGEDAPPTE